MKLHDVKTIFICIIFSFLFSAAANGQEFLFKVIAMSGKVTCQKKSTANWENIRTGDKIFAGEKLKLEAGDYLGLVSSKGRSLEIKQGGIYNAADLSKNIQKSPSTLQKFTDFVVNESAANKKKSENMKTLGAVVRSRVGLIDTFFPDFTNLLNSSFEPAWYSVGNGISYVIKLIDEDNHTVFIKETKDTSLSLDLSQFGLLKNHPYTWYVYSTGNDKSKSDVCTFRLLGESNVKSVSDSINTIKKDLDANSVVDRFILVKFLESKNLNCDALKGFDDLVKLNPAIEDYTNNYIAFLLKQNITRKAESLLPTNNK